MRVRMSKATREALEIRRLYPRRRGMVLSSKGLIEIFIPPEGQLEEMQTHAKFRGTTQKRIGGKQSEVAYFVVEGMK